MDWKQRIEKWGSEAAMLAAIVTVILWSHTSLSAQMDQIHEDIRCAHIRIDYANSRIDALGQRIDAHGTRMDLVIDNNQKILMELIKERKKSEV